LQKSVVRNLPFLSYLRARNSRKIRDEMTSTDKEILQIALPSILSNITVPLLGMVDVAIMGHLGQAQYIGAIAVGSMIFNVMYWLCGFLRMGTGGVGSRVHISAGSRVLSIVSGGNNDVARYADVVERSLLHEGRKHYFLVNFPQQPGALRRFLDEVLGPDDDITYFEYVKRSSREVGPALVGVELSNPGDYRFLLARITECGMEVNEVDSTSPYFRFLV